MAYPASLHRKSLPAEMAKLCPFYNFPTSKDYRPKRSLFHTNLNFKLNLPPRGLQKSKLPPKHGQLNIITLQCSLEHA